MTKEVTAASQHLTTLQIALEPDNAKRLANLCGELNEHIKLIAKRLHIKIRNRGGQFELIGHEKAVIVGANLLQALYDETATQSLNPASIHLHLQNASLADLEPTSPSHKSAQVNIHTKKLLIKPRGEHQRQYVQRMREYDINFGIGPAGTGKTWLAVAAACEALETHNIDRILLVRPAVEAGEKLGFLPGDLSEKVDPYLRPLYDALYEMLGVETVTKLQERQIIEVAPLAYMRGRTLSNCFVILDEAQNTTPEQMKMFLTRIGFGTKAIITGDITQVDLPRHQQSGLANALTVLKAVDAIGITQFDSQDIVRHPLVQRIVEAYERHEQTDKTS